MKREEVIKLYNRYVMPTYTRTGLVIAKGKGIRVWDIDAKEYLDFFPGWAVSGLGHCHPKIVKAIRAQAKKIIHVSNNYYHLLQGRLAKALSESSFGGKVFFCNSGAEANEAAIKLARFLGKPDRFEIISMQNSFHGRTLATLAATGQKKYYQGFEPLPAGFCQVPFNDFEALKGAVSPQTVAILLEPIQGEGGINVADKEYIQNLRRFCNEKKLLLIFDEVQTGMGRTGKLFCYEHYNVQPDIMTLAKSLGAGVPIAAIIAKGEIADTLKPGTHASTFGGSPICSAAALACLEAIEKEGLLANVNCMSSYLLEKLEELKRKYSLIKEIRGKGLMLGIELNEEGKAVVEKCMENGLLINCTQERVLRLMPPLIVTKKDIDKAITILDKAL